MTEEHARHKGGMVAPCVVTTTGRSQKKKIRRRNEVKPNTRPSLKRRLYFKYMMHLLRR